MQTRRRTPVFCLPQSSSVTLACKLLYSACAESATTFILTRQWQQERHNPNAGHACSWIDAQEGQSRVERDGRLSKARKLQGIAPIRCGSVVNHDWFRIVDHIEVTNIYIFSEPALTRRRDHKGGGRGTCLKAWW